MATLDVPLQASASLKFNNSNISSNRSNNLNAKMFHNSLIQQQSSSGRISSQSSIKPSNYNRNSFASNLKIATSTSTNSTIQSLFMSRLYAKSNQQKSWTDLTKLIRQCLLEKRSLTIDQTNRTQMQKCLDILQKNIEIVSIPSMIERLETICRQLNLKFTSANLSKCFVHSDMYYVEIEFDLENSKVIDCKISHHIHPPSTCHEMIDVLSRKDFVEFQKHLEGLTSIYKIHTDKSIKEKAFLALNALEKDLENLAEFQKNQINDINNLVHRSPAGVLESRKGGHPMKLTFFVSPYDLIDVKTKTIFPMTVDVIKEKSLGYSVTIGLEDSEQNHRLQIQSLLVVKQQNDGKNLPQFLSHTSMNSQTLPACYVLRLLRPLPICIDMIRKIYKLTGISQKFTTNNETELIALLKEQYLQSDQILSSQEDRDSSKRKSPIPFYTVLSDQSHLYYVNSLNEITDEENNEEPLSSMLIGTVVEKIPFTHPTHVPRILVFLRQQVLFNIILGSVIRNQSKQRYSGVEIFEISYTNITNIYIQFEHPIEHSLATLEIDLKDITQVKCKIHVPGTGSNGSYSKNQPNNSLNDEFVTKVMQKSLSIPITMRSLINKCRELQSKLKDRVLNDEKSFNQSNVIPSSSILLQAMQRPNSNLGEKFDRSNELKPEFYKNSKQNQSDFTQGSTQRNPQQLQTSQNSPLSSKTISKSNFNSKSSTMLMSMLSDIPPSNAEAIKKMTNSGAAQTNINTKKRKRINQTGGEIEYLESGTIKQRRTILLDDHPHQSHHHQSVQIKQESSSDSNDCLSSSSSIIEINECDNKFSKSDDGLNEQLKIIKSLEKISGQKDLTSSNNESKTVLKSEKQTSAKSILTHRAKSLISSPLNEQSDLLSPSIKKERKRKRADSLESKNSSSESLLSSGQSGLSTGSILSNMIKQGQMTKMFPQLYGSGSGAVTQSSKAKKTSPPIGGTNVHGNNNNGGNNFQSSPNLNKLIQAKQHNQFSVSSTIPSTSLSSSSTLTSILNSSRINESDLATGSSAQNSEAMTKRIGTKNATSKKIGLSSNHSNSSLIAQSGSKSPINISVSPTSSGSVASNTQQSSTSTNSNNYSRGKTSVDGFKQQSANISAVNPVSLSATSVSTTTNPSSALKQQQSSKNSSSSSITSPKISSSSTSLLSSALPSTLSSNASTTAKTNLGKVTKKASLTSVVDRLLQKNAVDGSNAVLSLQSSNPTSGTLTSPSTTISAETSTSFVTSSSSITNRNDNNFVKSARQSSESKSKFYRDSQFTIKQGNSGLKMSITKTKSGATSSSSGNSNQSILSSSNAADLISKIGLPVFKSSNKYTIPKIQKPSNVSPSSSPSTISSSSAGQSTITNVVSSTASTSPSTISTQNANNRRTNPTVSSSPSSKASPNSSSQPQHHNRMSGKNITGSGNNKLLFKSPELPPPNSASASPILQSYAHSNKSIVPSSNNSKLFNSFKQSNYGISPGIGSSNNWSSTSSSNVEKHSPKMTISASSPIDQNQSDQQKIASTSTPSSPAECSPLGVDNRSLPLIIPTEQVSDNSNDKKASLSAPSKHNLMKDSTNSSPTAKSTGTSLGSSKTEISSPTASSSSSPTNLMALSSKNLSNFQSVNVAGCTSSSLASLSKSSSLNDLINKISPSNENVTITSSSSSDNTSNDNSQNESKSNTSCSTQPSSSSIAS